MKFKMTEDLPLIQRIKQECDMAMNYHEATFCEMLSPCGGDLLNPAQVENLDSNRKVASL